jgi:hypothetical protein
MKEMGTEMGKRRDGYKHMNGIKKKKKKKRAMV